MRNKLSSLAKSQASPPSKWPDGTRRSQGNDFTAHLGCRPSIFASPKDLQAAAARSSSSANVERQRLLGKDPILLYGLSAKGEEARRHKRHQATQQRRATVATVATVAPKDPAP